MAVKKRLQKKAGAAQGPGAAPALSDEPRRKGSTREVQGPPGQRLDRPKLSSELAESAAPAMGSAKPSRRTVRGDSEPAVADSARPVLHPPAPAGPKRTLQHTFHLRPGLLVTIELPEDVTPAEIRRLCTFLEAVPFGAATSA